MLGVVVTGMASSGSTFIWQILNELGLDVTKSHTYTENRYRTVVATYRDPRDVVCSFAKRQLYRVVQEFGMSTAIKRAYEIVLIKRKKYEDIIKYSKRDDVILIRYEDYFVGNEVGLLDMLAEKLAISVSAQRKKEILEKFSLKNNKQIADTLGDFSRFDPETYLYGNHISNNGQHGAWKDIFTEEVHGMMNEEIKKFLIDFGYER